jgi:hypothetical protein
LVLLIAVSYLLRVLLDTILLKFIIGILGKLIFRKGL